MFSNIYNFLNSTFLNELIFQHQEKKFENTSETLMKMPSDEITSLLNEIRLYAMYYHGEEDIEEIISTLLDKYNNDLNNLINNDGLVLYTEEGLHNNLILSLNTLLDKLKRNADNNLEYNRIIDYIDKCIDGLNGKISDSPSELYRDLCRINHDILLNLSSNTNKSEEIRSKIISLLSEDKKKIEEYLSYISTLTQGINLRLDTKTLPYKNISEYENYFRMRLHPILENILNISKTSIQSIFQALEKTHNAREVAENFSVNRGTVYRLKRQLEETGFIETRTYLRGRKSALSREDIRNIEQLLKEKPDITIAEIIDTRIQPPDPCLSSRVGFIAL